MYELTKLVSNRFNQLWIFKSPAGPQQVHHTNTCTLFPGSVQEGGGFKWTREIQLNDP